MAEKKGEQNLPEIEFLLKGLMAQPGVEGFMAFNDEGIPLKWTTTGFVKPGAILGSNPIPPPIIHHAAVMGPLAEKARETTRRLLGEEGELSLIRLHTKNNEMIIAPTPEVTLVIVQRAHQGVQETIVEAAEREQAAAAAAAAGAKKAK